MRPHIKKKSIVIIHYQPLEYYPPACNFLNFLSSADREEKVLVFTTHNNRNRTVYTNDEIEFHRISKLDSKTPRWQRFIHYLRFNIGTALGLLRSNPKSILYYETFSAWPAFFYIKFFNKDVKLLIHNHEYSAPEWYENGMLLLKYFHRLEKSFLYQKASWISHTNEDRISFFLEDHHGLNKEKMRILPNYPPHEWSFFEHDQRNGKLPIRCVYVGALGVESTYIVEFCDWVLKMKGKITVDVFAYNISDNTRKYFNQLANPYVKLFEKGIEYERIPELFMNYDVGLILYKGLTKNVKYCAPNKSFEYLICGLDVWYPNEISGLHHYENMDSFPKVVRVDFSRLELFDVESAIDKSGLHFRPASYYLEKVYPKLVQALTEEN